MGARFDHLVVAVEDLDAAAARWGAAGLPAARGGAHPVGTENALVRGPEPAYVELIAAGREDSNPWLDRIRSARGPISWAVAVDDVDTAHAALVAAGFDPDPPVPGSRRTPDGGLLEWRVCDVATRPYDDSLPFLIQWSTPMPPGPPEGPVVVEVHVDPPDPDRVADLLLALGLEPSPHWPRRVFEPVGGGVRITLPLDVSDATDDRSRGDDATWTMGWPDDDPQPLASLVLRTSHGDAPTRLEVDGVGITRWPDRRRFAASALQPTSGEGSAPERAAAWVASVVAAGVGTAEPCAAAWADGRGPLLDDVRATRVIGPAGTQPVTVLTGVHPVDRDGVVVIGVGDPVEVVERQPTAVPGTTLREQVSRVDDAFVHALSGGIYAVRGRRRSVVRHPDGWGAHGTFAGGEPEQWLAEAASGRRTEGVLAGDPWL